MGCVGPQHLVQPKSKSAGNFFTKEGHGIHGLLSQLASQYFKPGKITQSSHG